ncbi:hypothetical protein C1N81_05470 (plasmid) [Streptomyces sp. SGAir0957]
MVLGEWGGLVDVAQYTRVAVGRARRRRRGRRPHPAEPSFTVAEVVPEVVRSRPALPRPHTCCTVEQVHGFFGSTVVVTTLHAGDCPVWSARS